MSLLRHAAVVTTLVCISQSVATAPLSYTCEVLHVYDLADYASLRSSNFERTLKGGSFSVSRVTGEIVGEVVPTLFAKAVRVISRGSTENSFKALADFDGQVQVLEVQEFRQGAIKPFIALSLGGVGVVTGNCK